MPVEKFVLKEGKCTFITPTLIKNTYLKRHCTGEVTRLISLEPHFNCNIITELNLSFLNITHIENLSLITNVTHLIMNQNNIKSIKNLERLTKLERLDLAYNEISKIENLERLTELKFLNLQGNKISKLENLNGNSKLRSLNVAYNEISDINEIFYMKRFKHLRFLAVENNPFGTDYRPIIMGKFPDLKSIDDKTIMDTDRPKREALLNDIKDKMDPKNVKYFNSKLQRDSFLNITDGEYFIKVLYSGDADGQILNKWCSTVRIAFEEYQNQMTVLALDMCDISLKNLAIRNESFSKFKMAHYKFITKWVQHCCEKINELEEIKMQFLNSDSVPNGSTIVDNNLFLNDDIISLFETKVIKALTDYLKYINRNMHTSIQTLIKKVEDVLEDKTKTFLQLLTPIFFNMREVESNHSKALSRAVKSIVENTKQTIPDMIIQHFKNRSALMQAVDKTTDYHLELIYKREAMLINDAKTWLKSTIEDLNNSERQRYWMIFEELDKLHEDES